MLGGGNILDADWATAATDIPAHLHDINAAMIQLTGMGLAHVILTSVGWQKIVNNTKVQDQGGSSGPVFESLRRVSAGEFTAMLRGLPWLTFHVIDYGLEIYNGSTETFTKLIDDDHAAFLPEPGPRWVQYLEGSEIRHRRAERTEARAFWLLCLCVSHARPQRLGTVRRLQRHSRALHAVGRGVRADHGRELLGVIARSQESGIGSQQDIGETLSAAPTPAPSSSSTRNDFRLPNSDL